MSLTAQAVLQNGKYSLNIPKEDVFELIYPATTDKSERVIIKTLAENLRSHPNFEQFKQQFLTSAQRLSQCQHPNLAKVIDYFEEAGLPYLVIEDIPGQTLAELIYPSFNPPLDREEGLSEAKAIQCIRQIGAALSVLHQRNIIHQDVKPKNIIRRQGTDEVVLTGFGIACDLTPGIRQTHAALLSAGYAPPEQYQSGRLTPKCDIYALAATFYALLTGEPPFPAPLRVSKSSPSEFRTGLHRGTRHISPNLERVISRGLHIEARRRPQTVEEWLALLPKEPIEELNSSQLLFLTPPQPLKSRFVKGRTALQKAKRSPWRSLFMTGALAASAGIGFGWAIRTHQPTEPGSTLFPPRSIFPAAPRLARIRFQSFCRGRKK